jgi:methylisocitrate lyase
MTAAALRAMLAAGRVTHAPGVYDPASAALAVRAGHRAVHLAGPAIAATMLGEGAPATQVADRAALLAPALGGVPLLADADLGLGSPDQAVWTALAYQRAGISGVVLDDAEDAALTTARITALVTQVPEVVLIARARGRGLAGTIERCRVYADAGVDAVLPVDVDERNGLGRVRAALPGVPLAVSRSGAATGADLSGLGVVLVLHPLAAVLAALRAASLTYRAIADEGDAEPVDRLPLAVLADLAVTAASPPRPSTPWLRDSRPPAQGGPPAAGPGPEIDATGAGRETVRTDPGRETSGTDPGREISRTYPRREISRIDT